MKLFEIKLPSYVTEQGSTPSSGALLRETVGVAWPSMLESFLMALVGMLDTMMVGTLGAYAIAAVGLTINPKFVGLAVFLSLNVAVSAVVARRRGEEDWEGAVRVLRQALLVTLILTVMISALAVIFADPIIRFAGSDTDTHGQAVIYFRLIMGAMIFNTVSLVINAAQRGAGNTRVAMWANMMSNLVNVVFNYLFIGGNFGFPRLEVTGAAIATVMGSMVACGTSLYSVSRKESRLNIWKSAEPFFKVRFGVLRTLGAIWSGSALEQVFARFGFFSFAILVANLGTTAFAANQIGTNWLSLSFSFADGLSVATVALVGRSLGQGRKDLAVLYSSLCQRIGLLFSVGLSVLFITMGRMLFALFTDEAPVLEYAMPIAMMLSVVTYLQVSAVIYLGALRSAGDALFVAVILMVSIALIRPSVGWVLAYPFQFGLIGAWFGIVADQLLRLILAFARYRKGAWLNHKKI